MDEKNFEELLNVTDDELKKLGDICYLVSSKYLGKPKDIKIFAELKHEMEGRCYDAGFVVKVMPKSVALPDGTTIWQPDCQVVGRVDKVDFDPERIAATTTRESGLIL